MHDIKTVVQRRNQSIPLLLRPAQVQGEGAAQDLADALSELAKVPQVDVIIIGRGGGSMEDLWAFNEEVLVRAVAACPIPVISAVGHETDVTLCDFAADVRAATPSAAAELAAPDARQLQEQVSRMGYMLAAAANNRVQTLLNSLNNYSARLKRNDPRLKVEGLLHEVKHLRLQLRVNAAQRMDEWGKKLETSAIRLQNASPIATLRRGYALVMDGQRVVKSSQNAPETMRLVFHDGQITVQKQQE